MKKIIISVIIVVILVFAGIARADIVELDLFTLGCDSIYDYNEPSWSGNFDLDTIFSQIDHVYMNWAGQITGAMAVEQHDPDNPFPADVGIYSFLGSNPEVRVTIIWGGEETHPSPESFEQLSEVELLGTSTWSDLLDGKGTIVLGYEEAVMLSGGYVQHGSVALTRAILVVEGAAVPEPATIFLLSLGTLFAKLQTQIERVEQ